MNAVTAKRVRRVVIFALLCGAVTCVVGAYAYRSRTNAAMDRLRASGFQVSELRGVRVLVWQKSAYVVVGKGKAIDDGVLDQTFSELRWVPRLSAVYLEETSVTRDGAARLFETFDGNVRVELDEGRNYVSFRERQ